MPRAVELKVLLLSSLRSIVIMVRGTWIASLVHLTNKVYSVRDKQKTNSSIQAEIFLADIIKYFAISINTKGALF